jgi:hypothetical protein
MSDEHPINTRQLVNELEGGAARLAPLTEICNLASKALQELELKLYERNVYVESLERRLAELNQPGETIDIAMVDIDIVDLDTGKPAAAWRITAQCGTRTRSVVIRKRVALEFPEITKVITDILSALVSSVS